jgi:hypothetical protein
MLATEFNPGPSPLAVSARLRDLCSGGQPLLHFWPRRPWCDPRKEGARPEVTMTKIDVTSDGALVRRRARRPALATES